MTIKTVIRDAKEVWTGMKLIYRIKRIQHLHEKNINSTIDTITRMVGAEKAISYLPRVQARRVDLQALLDTLFGSQGKCQLAELSASELAHLHAVQLQRMVSRNASDPVTM